MESLEAILIIAAYGLGLAFAVGVMSFLLAIFAWSIWRGNAAGIEDRRILLASTGFIPVILTSSLVAASAYLIVYGARGPEILGLLIGAIAAIISLIATWPVTYLLCCKILHILPRKAK